MIKINLLPEGREKTTISARPSAPKVSFDWLSDVSLYVGVGAGALLFIILLIIHIVQVSTISSIKKDIDAKNKELKKLQVEVKMVEELKKQKNIFEQRLNAIKTLVGDRVLPVHLWTELNNALPQFVWLNSLKESGGQITLKGNAFTKIQISEFYNRLNASPYFDNVQIKEIKTTKQKDQTVDEFTITMKLVVPKNGNKNN